MIIDLGSGPHPKKDADIKMDFNDFPGVNVKHDLLDTPYPFEDNKFDKAYLGDVIEHILIFDRGKMLKEILRILKPGAYVDITCPDMRWFAERIVKNDYKKKAKGKWMHKFPTDFENIMHCMYGGFYDKQECRMKGMGHVAGYDFDSLKKVLTNCGFSKVEKKNDPRNECILRVFAYKGKK